MANGLTYLALLAESLHEASLFPGICQESDGPQCNDSYDRANASIDKERRSGHCAAHHLSSHQWLAKYSVVSKQLPDCQ